MAVASLLPALVGGCDNAPPPPNQLRGTFVATAPAAWQTQNPYGADVAFLSPPESAQDTYRETILIVARPIAPQNVDEIGRAHV